MRGSNRGTFLGVGGEASYGTDGTVDRWFHAIDVNASYDREIIDQPSMHQSTGSTNVQHSSLGPAKCEVSATLIPTYTGFGTVLLAALGSLATTGGVAPYTHTFKLSATDAASLTVEVPTGDTGDSDTYGGWMVSSWEFSVEAGSANYAKFMVKGPAQKRLGRATSSTPTFTGGGINTPVLYWQGSAVTFNSVSYVPKSFKIAGDHKYGRVDVIGSADTAQPVRDGFGSYTASMTIEVTNAEWAALYTAQLAGTQGDVVITFTSGSTSMVWTLHNAKLQPFGKPIQGAGRLTLTVTWKGYSDGTDEGVSVVVINAQSSGLAV